MNGSQDQSSLIIKYSKALKEDPSSRVFAPLAAAYRKLGLTDKAMAVLKKGIQYNPTYIYGYITLADCYNDLEQWQLAYSTLKPLVSDNLDNLKLLSVYAGVCEKLNENLEGLNAYKQLLFLNPKDSNTQEKVKHLEGELHESPILEPDEDSYKGFDISNLEDSINEWSEVDLTNPLSEDMSDDWSMRSLSDTPSDGLLNELVRNNHENIAIDVLSVECDDLEKEISKETFIHNESLEEKSLMDYFDEKVGTDGSVDIDRNCKLNAIEKLKRLKLALKENLKE